MDTRRQEGLPVNPRITLIECVDIIDDCNWGDWVCSVEWPDGRVKPGNEMGAILKAAMEAQLDGHFATVEDAILWAKNEMLGNR